MVMKVKMGADGDNQEVWWWMVMMMKVDGDGVY